MLEELNAHKPGTTRVVWIITIIALVSGCSRYQKATLPTSETLDGGGSDLVAEVGSKVRVTMVSGTVQEGEVVSVIENKLILGRYTNFGYKEKVISIDQIRLIEIEGASKNTSVILIAAAVLVVVGVFAAIVNKAALDEELSGAN